MTYQLTVRQQPTYLHVIVTGPNIKENVASYLAETLRECAARNCQRVLIEERLTGPRLGILDVFQIASQAGSNGRAGLSAMAYVDVNAEGDSMQFAENVAVNRGLSVSIFPTVSDAEKWLLNLAPSAQPADAGGVADQPVR